MKTLKQMSYYLLGLVFAMGMIACSSDHDPKPDNFGKAEGGFKITTSKDLYNAINIEAEVITFKNGVQKVSIDENVVTNLFETSVNEFPMKASLSLTMTPKEGFTIEEGKMYDLSIDIETHSTIYDNKDKQLSSTAKSFHLGSTQDTAEGFERWLKQTFNKPITAGIEINKINDNYVITIK